MSVLAVEGIINEGGQVQLIGEVALPHKTKVYVVVPGLISETEVLERIQVYSPRLKRTADLRAFLLEVDVEEEVKNGGV